MRRLLITSSIVLLSASAFAAPEFRPLDSNMRINAPAASAAPAPAAQAPIQFGAPIPSSALPVSHSGEVIDSVGSNAIPSLPLEAITANNITYLSGGIGDEEEAQLASEEHNYNLRLLITGQSGEYLSEVSLVLKDAKGNQLMSIDDAGPMVYIKLPAGAYQADLNGPTGAKPVALKVPATGALKTQIRL